MDFIPQFLCKKEKSAQAITIFENALPLAAFRNVFANQFNKFLSL